MRDLVQNAKVQVDRTLNLPRRRSAEGAQAQSQGSTGQKRSAEAAFDDIIFPPPPRGMAIVSTAMGVPAAYQPLAHNGQSRLQPSHVYHQGLQRDGPTQSAYAGYMPGYDSWWPVLESQADVAGAASGPTGSARHPDDGSARSAGMVVPSSSGPAGATGMPSQDFTFTTQHFSPEFLQAMRDPVIHFPSAFAHQGF